MRVKLHIGFHKCGSSALQVGMAKCRLELVAKGVLYPTTHSLWDGHHKLAWALINKHPSIAKGHRSDEQSSEQLLDAWFSEATDNRSEVIVLSSEEFEFLPPNAISRLKALLAGHDVEIYAYVRPQDEYLISEYKQQVRMAETAYSGTIDHFFYQHQLNGRFNYWGIMNRWAACFGAGSVIVTSYHRPGLVGQDMLTDFAAAANLPPFDLPKEREQNVSWGNLTSKVMAEINAFGIPPTKRSELAEQLDKIVKRQNIEVELLDVGRRKALIASYKESNQKLLSDFAVRGDASRLLDRAFGPSEPAAQETSMITLLTQVLVEKMRQ